MNNENIEVARGGRRSGSRPGRGRPRRDRRPGRAHPDLPEQEQALAGDDVDPLQATPGGGRCDHREGDIALAGMVGRCCIGR